MSNQSAFPQNTVYLSAGGHTVRSGPEGGMTLRDYFAAKAMVVLMETDVRTAYVASNAYAMADAMLKERDGQ